jgi:O-antigen ligase
VIDDATPARRPRLGADAVLASYAVLLLVIPSRYTVGSFAITAAMIVGLVAAGMWLSGLLLPDRVIAVTSEPARRGVLVFLTFMFVSYLVAMLRPLPDVAAGSADRHLAALISVAGVALLATDGLRSRDALYNLLGVVVAAGGALAAIGIMQYVGIVDLAGSLRPPGFELSGSGAFVYARSGLDRVAGTARHPIEFGIVCAMLLPLALHLSAHAATRLSRRASAVAAMLLAVALPMALSRAAVIGAMVAVFILLVSWPPARRWRLLAGGVAVVVLTTFVAGDLLRAIRDLFITDAASGSNSARRRSADAAVDLFLDEPWLGQGYGTQQEFVVDNQLLVTLVESGVLGILGLLVLLNGCVFAARSARRRTDDDGLRDLGMTLIAAVSAAVVGSFGLATLIYPMTAGLLFLTIGLAGSLDRITADERSHSLSTSRTTAALVHQ